jgi:hypothetical protein
LTDNRLGLGDQIVTATAGVAHAAGTTAGLVIAAPVAVIDQNTRENYAHHVGALGVTVPAGGPAKTVSNDCRANKTNACDR